MSHDPIDLINLIQRRVITHLVLNPEHDKEATGKTYHQPRNIDSGIRLVPADIPERSDEVVSKHVDLLSR